MFKEFTSSVVVLTVVPGCFPGVCATPDYPPAAEVRVTDATTGTPLSGAIISVGNGLAEEIETGTFLAFTPPGTYAVTISAPGFEPQTIEDVRIAQNFCGKFETVHLAVLLQPAD